MYTNVFGMPVRRSAALAGAATVLAAGALVGATAVPANADGGSKGSASAVNARVDLDVSLVKGSADVPVNVVLNDVQAPESDSKTLLKATVKGYDEGKPFTFVKARVAHAKATVDADKAEGYAELAGAKVKVPGLPNPVVAAKLVTAKATCAVGAKPVADAKVPGELVLLGKSVVLDAQGKADVKVPGVGEVHVVLSEEVTSSDSAAAAAVKVNFTVNPLKLNVAKVKGDVVISEAKCMTPGGGGDTGGSTGGDTDGGSTAGSGGGDTKGTTSGTSGGDTDGASAGSAGGNEPGPKGGGDLAETGGGSTLAIGGAGAALIAGGAVALWMKRRRAAVRN